MDDYSGNVKLIALEQFQEAIPKPINFEWELLQKTITVCHLLNGPKLHW
jgi:hypothetical protein